MKKKLSKKIPIIDFITKTSKFKIIFILMLITVIYASLLLPANQNNLFKSIILTHTFPMFNVMFFSVLSLNTINTCTIFCKNDSYIIRLKNKKATAKELVKLVLQVNTLLIICFLLIYFMLLSLSQFGYYQTTEVFKYHITTKTYSIFLIIRYYLYALIFSAINTILYLKLKEKKTLILNIIFIVMFSFISLELDNVSFNFLPWHYFTLINYNSFIIELKYSLIYLSLLIFVFIILFNIPNKKNLSLTKYLFKSDLNYLIKKQKNILLLIVTVPVVVLITRLSQELSSLELLKSALALDITKNSYNILDYVIYLFNILSYIFITNYLYLKDYQVNLDKIYLRTDFKKFYLQKTTIFLIFTFIIMFIQYFLLILVLAFTNHPIILKEIIKVFIINYLFITLIQQIFVSAMIIYSSFSKLRIGLIILGIISFIFIPKNIINLNAYYLLLALILVIIINKTLNKKYHKKIIQYIGGI